MARGTIKQRIALEGGDEIKKEFEELGKAGEKAFKLLEDAAKGVLTPWEKLSVQIKTFQSEFKKLSAAGARVRDDFGRLGTALGNVGRAGGIVARNIGLLMGAVGGAATGLFLIAKAGAEAADAADEMAQSVGLGVESLGKLSFAAEQSGTSQEKLVGALGKFNIALDDAKTGGKNSVALFKELGVKFKDLRGQLRPTEDVLFDVADAFARMPDGAQKAALVMELFGKAGRALIPFLNLGSEGIKKLGLVAEASGILTTDAAKKIGSDFTDATDRLGKAIAGTRNQIGLLFAPTFVALADGFSQAINENRSAILALVNDGIRVALPILRDFIYLLTGNREKIQTKWILDAADGFKAFGQDVAFVFNSVVRPTFTALVKAGELVAGAINGIFGTDLSGKQVLLSAGFLQLIGVFGVVGASAGAVVAALGLLSSSFTALIATGPALAAFWGVLVTGATAFGAGVVALVGWPVLIAAGIAAAGAAIYAFWDEIQAGGKAAFDFVSGLFSAENFANLGSGLASAATSAGQLFIAAWKAQIDLFRSARDAMANLVIASFIDLGSRIAKAIERATGVKVDLSNFKDIANRIVEPFKGIPGAITDALAGIGDAITGAFQSALNSVNSIVESITNAVSKLKALVSGTSTMKSSFDSGATGGGSGFASGGYVSGPGTGTSDSIVARLSNGEFVVKAEAVRKYGSGLLSAINNMRLSPNALSSLKGFASGGLVQGGGSVDFSGLIDGLTVGMSHRSRMPAFANGGLVEAPRSGGRPINLTIGNETYEFQAREDVAEKLAKHIANGRLKSAGKRPSWG